MRYTMIKSDNCSALVIKRNLVLRISLLRCSVVLTSQTCNEFLKDITHHLSKVIPMGVPSGGSPYNPIKRHGSSQ